MYGVAVLAVDLPLPICGPAERQVVQVGYEGVVEHHHAVIARVDPGLVRRLEGELSPPRDPNAKLNVLLSSRVDLILVHAYACRITAVCGAAARHRRCRFVSKSLHLQIARVSVRLPAAWGVSRCRHGKTAWRALRDVRGGLRLRRCLRSRGN